MKAEIVAALKEYRTSFARSGGIARAKKLSKMRRKEIAIAAVKARIAKRARRNGKGGK